MLEDGRHEASYKNIRNHPRQGYGGAGVSGSLEVRMALSGVDAAMARRVIGLRKPGHGV